MNPILDQFRNRRITIIGAGREGTAVARFLAPLAAEITLSDAKNAAQLGPTLAQLEGLPVRLALGENRIEDVAAADIVFLSPGVPRWTPAVEAAFAMNKPVWSETRLVFALCRAPIIGVTGSSGKTTTTSLIGHILAAAGRQTVVGGNIGTPLVNQVEDIPADALVVLELSSFQLQELGASPWIAVVTTITPDHLDVHRSMDEYVEAKRTIVRHQGPGDTAVLNADNEIVRGFADGLRSRAVYFSTGLAELPGIGVEEGYVVARLDAAPPVRVAPVEAIRLRGRHNLANVCAATAACLAAGVGPKVIAGSLPGFTAPEHRIEFVAEISGVSYYNDSIATTPDRATSALLAFDTPVILIAGGQGKQLDYSQFGRLVAERCKAVVLMGGSAELERAIEAAPPPHPPLLRVAGLEAAVEAAASQAVPGDTVLLSPAYTSFDQFPDYTARGRAFKDAVARVEVADGTH